MISNAGGFGADVLSAGGSVGDTVSSLLRKLNQTPCHLIVVASHPRSGTHLCIDTLRLNFADCHSWKLPFEAADKLYCTLDNCADGGRFSPEHVLRILQRASRPVIKTHALPMLESIPVWTDGPQTNETELAHWVWDHSRIIYMYRDGREVMRSFYEFYPPGHDARAESFSDFLRQKINGQSRPRIWANHIKSWFSQEQALCVSMESLLSRPADALRQIAAHVGLAAPMNPELPRRCDNDLPSRMWRRAAIHPVSTAISSRYSFSPDPHWTEFFTQADRDFFAQETGDLLIRLRYETSDLWVHQQPRETRPEVRKHEPALFGFPPDELPEAPVQLG